MKASNTAVPLNTWTHIAAVVRGPTDMSIYINGSDAGGNYGGSGGEMVHSDCPARLGTRESSRYFQGFIDEAGVFNRALSAADVAAIYGAESAGKWCFERLCDGNDDNANALVDEGCDDDGDQFCDGGMTVTGTPSVCPAGSGDCDDSNDIVYPLAPQLCDGINNDCSDANWPTVPGDEFDDDSDRFRICAGDCNDADDSIHPAAPEVCNGIDDNCNSLTDDDANGEDSDGDIVFNVCDNCPADPNPLQDDVDSDLVGDVCDNCTVDWNPGQSDFDGDLEGDRCDPDDGLVFLYFNVPGVVEWDLETGFDGWNCYAGDLGELESSGVYTQVPGSNPLADRDCLLSTPYMNTFTIPAPGRVAFYLAAGMTAGIEVSLGTDSGGTERPNDNSCVVP